MSDLISRSKLQFAIKRNQTIMRDGEHYIRLSAVLEKLRIAPAVDAAPVVRAFWRHIGGDEWCCTDCALVISTEGSWENPWQAFCPNCGAKMDGGAP